MNRDPYQTTQMTKIYVTYDLGPDIFWMIVTDMGKENLFTLTHFLPK